MEQIELSNENLSTSEVHSDVDEMHTDFKAPMLKNSNEKDQLKDSIPVMSIIEPKLDYTPPEFAVIPSEDEHYGFEVIKNGTLIDRIDFEKRKRATFVVVGRLPSCDIQLEHPTISRHHCILQYGEDLMNRTGQGWHIYDLGSTHGTKLNKKKIPPKQFIRIRVGYVLQFGGSSRIMTLFGPQSDIEKEWEYSPTEMKRLIEQKKLYDKMQKEKEKELESENVDEGVMWGMDYDEELAYAQAHEEDVQNREEKYRDDPLKALSRFFEKEGFDMEFKYEETGVGHNHKWTCSIELPVDTAAGQSLAASATCSGSKKEAQALCALNACRILDTHGVLFRSANEARKKAKNLADNDYYDSDEDTYYDRTGQIEKNREKRRQRDLEAKGKTTTEIETFETLTKKIASINEELNKIENQLTTFSANVEEKEDDGNDDLDRFCKQMRFSDGNKESMAVKTEKSKLRQRLVFLKHEKERMEKLAKIAKPVELPSLKIPSSDQGVTRATGSLSLATMKKLMKMRRNKIPVTEEKQKDKPIGMELPSDTFIKESADSQPFVAEIEDDEKPTTSGIISSTSVTIAADTTEANNLTEIQSNSQEKPVSKNPDEFETNGAKTALLSEKIVDPESVQRWTKAIDIEHKSTVDDKEPTRRKRTRVRDCTSSKREKTGDYGDGAANKDEDYVMWMPPADQKGDGTNALNAKFAGRY